MITSSNTDRDRQLLDRLKQGDENALKEIVDLYYTPLCVYSVQFTECEQESEDIVQDLFIRIWEKRLFDNITNLRMYLFISVHNMSVAAAKHHNNYEDIEELESMSYQSWEDGFTEDDIAEKRLRLQESLKKLSPKEYDVLIRIIINDRKYKEVAEEMGVSVNTIKMHLKRAMKKLRNEEMMLLIYFF